MKEQLLIHQIFNQVADKFPTKIALQIKKNQLWYKFSYAQIKEYSLKVANFLILKGLKKGDFVVLILENRPEWAVIYLGIVWAGCVCVPLDTQMSEFEIKSIVEDTSSKVIFCSNRIFKEKLEKILGGYLEIVILDNFDNIDHNINSFQDIINSLLPKNINLPEISPDSLASLIYTSGTTGNLKAVMLSHKNICSNFLSIKKLNLCSDLDNFLSVLPLHHSYPFMVSLIVPLFSGAKVTYLDRLDIKEFLDVIKEESVTVLVAVPQFFELLHKIIFDRFRKIPFIFRLFTFYFLKTKIKNKFGSVRIMISGGAKLDKKIAKDLNRLGLRLVEGYGLTEASPVVSFNPLQKIKFGSVGRCLPDVEVKILNPDKNGIGEILVKGPNVAVGYFKNQKLTAETIKDGWLYTADLGYLDKDGYLYIVGRKKEMIVLSSGKNIYPEELEQYYRKSPYIKEICILKKQEKIFGYDREILFAVIVPDLEYFAKKNELNIRQRIRVELDILGRKLPSYQHIMGFVLTKEELPKTALKKIKRYKVEEKFLCQYKDGLEKIDLTEEDIAILEKSISKSIINYLKKEIKRPVSLDSHLEIDLGIDSLTRVELGLGLERILKIKIPDDLLYSVTTVKDLILGLEKLVEAKTATKETYQKNWSEILRQLPSKNTLNKIKLNFGVYQTFLTYLLKNIFLFIFRLFWRLKVEGYKNLPKEGPYIIYSNHASYLDGPFIFLSLPFRISMNTYFIGHRDFLQHPIFSWANKVCRLIPIDINKNFVEAMQAASFVLQNKKIVCIFPEGTRSTDGKIKDFKNGIAILVKELNIPALPTYIKGSYRSWPRYFLLPRFCSVKVIFSKLLYSKDLPNSYSDISKVLKNEIEKLQDKYGI